jgi:hypothetical protein
MSKRRVDRSWGTLGVVPTRILAASSFETLVTTMGLAPEDYKTSPELREWARINRDRKYVPSDLLREWGLDQEPEL